MKTAVRYILALQTRISDRGRHEEYDDFAEYLAAAERDNGIDLRFHGEPFGESYEDLVTTISAPQVAPWIRSLLLSGPDEGANGTKNWDLESLVSTDSVFERLQTFNITLNSPADHNRSIVARTYDEDGVLAKLLVKSPNLRVMQVPSAPDATFFVSGTRPIEVLSVDAGYDAQNFIQNLTKADTLPSLRCLEWGEYCETYIDQWQDHCTPLQAFHDLFRSKAFRKVTRFVFRNPVFSDSEIVSLKSIKPTLQLLVIRSTSHYVQ